MHQYQNTTNTERYERYQRHTMLACSSRSKYNKTMNAMSSIEDARCFPVHQHQNTTKHERYVSIEDTRSYPVHKPHNPPNHLTLHSLISKTYDAPLRTDIETRRHVSHCGRHGDFTRCFPMRQRQNVLKKSALQSLGSNQSVSRTHDGFLGTNVQQVVPLLS